MAFGYEKGFVIEYVSASGATRKNCRSCSNYDSGDKTCLEKGYYLPLAGYDSWKYCGCSDFYLSKSEITQINFKSVPSKRQKPSKTIEQERKEENETKTLEEKQKRIFEQKIKTVLSQAPKVNRGKQFPPNTTRGSIKDYKVGAKIYHFQKGKGRIVSIQNEKVTIEYKKEKHTQDMYYCLLYDVIRIFK